MTINTTKVFTTPTGIQQYEQVFLTSGTWVKPAGVKTAEITCIGGGGGAYSPYYPGSGGGYIKRIVNVSSLPTNNSVIVGAGGLSSINVGGVSIGGTSSFANLITAYGGGAYTTRYSNYSTYYGTAESGLAESIQHNMGGMSVLNYREQYYGNLAGTATTPIPGGNSQQGNNKIAYGNGNYVAVSGQQAVYYSTDGNTWTQSSNIGTTFGQVAFGLNYFVLVPNASSTTAYYSTTGASGTWTSSTLPASQIWTGVCFGNGTFVAYASGLTQAAYSTNGTTWTTMTLPSAAGPTMVYAGGYFITAAIRSTTGQGSWTATSMPITPTYISYGNGIWLAHVNSSSSYYTSTDGTTWTLRSFSPGGNNVSTSIAVASNYVFMNDRFVVSCSQGALGASYYYSGFTHFWTSTDGINWVFSRSKWNNSSNLQNTGNAFHCITDAVQGPVSGQYFAIIWGYGVENNALLYNYGVIAKFSTYFYGGFPGQIMTRITGLSGMITSTWFNMGAGSFYFAAPGAFGRAEGIRTFNRQVNATSSTIGQYNRGPGTPEGWCMGGRSFGNSYSFGLDMFRTAVINNYGCGADASGVNYPVPPAGQGMVIVRWWQ